MPVDAAIRLILQHNIEIMLRHQVLAQDGSQIEGVHQMRVALRRMRSALSLFRGLLDPKQSQHWREQMRELASQLGRARDLDVFITEGLADTAGKLPLPGEAALHDLALRKRAETQVSAVLPLLESSNYQRFCVEFPSWVNHSIESTAVIDDKRSRSLARPILKRARKLLDKQARQVLDAGRSVDRHDALAMHQLRIECKKLRYAAEFFRPLFSGMGDFIACMKAIQDVLGVMNDQALTRDLLNELLSAGPDDPELQRYAGALIGWRSYHFHHLLDDFDHRWNALVAAGRPWWD